MLDILLRGLEGLARMCPLGPISRASPRTCMGSLPPLCTSMPNPKYGPNNPYLGKSWVNGLGLGKVGAV